MKARASELFVGREDELRELTQALDAARAGNGSTVLVAGEAGIGKTRLVSELARRARRAGFEVLLGRAIDLVGTELPYQPFVEALRPLGEPGRFDRPAGSQLDVFRDTLAVLTDRAAGTPVLLVLEDLHWADMSTLDLVAFLAHNLDDQPLLLLVTYRADELSSAERMRRLAEAVRHSSAAIAGELGPLEDEQVAALLAAHADGPVPAPLADTILARAEGNPLFAEELVDAARTASGALPLRLRDLLLQRVSQVRRSMQTLLRLAAAARRDIEYSLLRETSALSERDVRESVREAVEHGILVADQAAGSFRFPSRAARRSHLRDDLARRARRVARPPRRGVHTRWARPGRARAALGGGAPPRRSAVRVRRSGAPVGDRVRPDRGSCTPRTGARAVGRGPERNRTHPPRPGRALLVDRRAREPDRRGTPRDRAGAAGSRTRR